MVFTDRHLQIHKMISVDPSINNIKQKFDPWHVTKGICKSLNKASVKKNIDKLLQWILSIVNHFWWSVSTRNKDLQVLYEKVTIYTFAIFIASKPEH